MRRAALAGSVLSAALVGVVPVSGLSPAARAALAVAAFAAGCWITGALPLPVTAALVPPLAAVTGAQPTLSAAFAPMADPVVFLLFAGFVLAAALERHGVDRRVAFLVVRSLGTSPRRLLLAVMVTTAGLSMLLSNSATTAMMVPVAVSVARAGAVGTDGGAPNGNERPNFERALLLGTAYAASIGGVGTLIGTPPNAIVVAALAEAGIHVGFAEWLAIGLPVVAVGLPVAWLLLLWLFPPGEVDVARARRTATEGLASAGGLDRDARVTVAVVAATAVLWLVGGLGFLVRGQLPTDVHAALFGGRGLLHYVVVGLLGVGALFALGAVEWDEVTDIDWGTLLLLGGGIALADALDRSGAVAYLATAAVETVGDIPVAVLVFGLVVGVVALSELASNTATAAVLAPILVGVGPRYATALGTTGDGAAAFLAVVGAVAASFGFALPVATPPNAIAFGTGHVERDDMLRAGVVLDAAMALVASGSLYLLFRFVLSFG
ncbi:SLC13 family permease [Halorarius halobius]|uniref:SLC13 family permease n=1 Tax=Halorarius halobius TaxID=2962671 RepID=UPI0020CDA7D0|nr:DASS family sodium-coupled anion symporter [Halorarius halobius]